MVSSSIACIIRTWPVDLVIHLVGTGTIAMETLDHVISSKWEFRLLPLLDIGIHEIYKQGSLPLAEHSWIMGAGITTENRSKVDPSAVCRFHENISCLSCFSASILVANYWMRCWFSIAIVAWVHKISTALARQKQESKFNKIHSHWQLHSRILRFSVFIRSHSHALWSNSINYLLSAWQIFFITNHLNQPKTS